MCGICRKKTAFWIPRPYHGSRKKQKKNQGGKGGRGPNIFDKDCFKKGARDYPPPHLVPRGNLSPIVCHLAPSCAILRRFAPFCTVLGRFAPFCAVLRRHRFAPFSLAPSCAVLHCFALFCAVLHRFGPSFTVSRLLAIAGPNIWGAQNPRPLFSRSLPKLGGEGPLSPLKIIFPFFSRVLGVLLLF